MGSAKTMNLLAVSHNYRQQNKKTLLLKPKLDVRFGESQIRSRAGLSSEADILLSDNSFFSINGKSISGRDNKNLKHEIPLDNCQDLSCILVDEAQFLSKELIDELYHVTIVSKIPVIAYGLKTDFKDLLFEGSKRLMELSDTVEEIKTTCFYCEKKATSNIRLVDGAPAFSGETIVLGADEKYHPCCKYCRFKMKNHCGVPLHEAPKKIVNL